MATTKTPSGGSASANPKLDLTQAMSQVLMPVLMFEHEGLITFFNQASEKLWGLKASVLIGKNVKSLFEQDPFENASSHREGVVMENIVLTGKGEKLPVTLTITAMGTNGSTLYTLFVQDLSPMKQLEMEAQQKVDQIKASEEELRQKLEEIERDTQSNREAQEQMKRELETRMSQINVACIVSESDLKGNIIYVNDKLCEVSQYTREECIGQPHSMFRHPDTPKEVFKEMWSTIGRGQIFRGKIKNRKKDGSPYWVDALIAPVLGPNGKPVKYIGVRYDITETELKTQELEQAANEMKAAEEELRQNMEELSATQEEMARKQIEIQGQMSAIDSTNASIEFKPDGTIISANELFLSAMQYNLTEIEGKHHRMFCDPSYAKSREYELFWDNLRNGRPQVGEFKRIAKDGSEVWIMANYTPVMNQAGVVVKVIKLATNITEQKLKNLDMEGQLEAVGRSSAVIQFDMAGNTLTANENFLSVVGYSLSEIKGRHHRMFVDASYANSQDYKEFWAKLGRGEFVSDTFMRISKSGKPVYIQASYNPIFDLNGNPYKVVKYATDVTEFTTALKAVSNFASELKKGNLNASMDIQASGDLGQMIKDNLALRDTVREILEKVNETVHLAGNEGKLSSRVNVNNPEGAWKQLVDSINLLLQSIAEPMLEFNTLISQMAKGDLTRKFEMASNGDVKNMGDSLNTAIDNLNKLLRNIERNAQTVAGSSTNMIERSESIKNNSNEVATAIAQMAKGAQDQALRTDESSKLVEEVMKSANDMERKANIINKAAEQGQKSSENGLKIIKNLVENMEGISSSAGKTSQSIEVLTQRAEEIARTLNVITDIASQTNLLALNAAIEAARAGDAGRGFAVVAEEIRKLAEDSRRSAVDIEKIIKDVQKDTNAAGKAIETMESSVKQGNSASKEAESIFVEIAKSSDDTFTYSKEIQEATSLQKGTIDSVVKNIEQIVVVAEETAAGTQQIASSSQELNGSMEEITDASNRLSEIALELQSGIGQFKLQK
ncbi:PAS domain S-box protein [Cytophagales bacterium LB-30]|uniref:PAS domain S-box protein n=1 Tax=Shiella aurantiaca TaxID=3058365 RepID=A0ABT8F634_9BACT|nr:PAS domain S-box protein [Shiella aurantiaca]MDN4165916.1 PAS domain S-box protein [Shiella aurantiaca]